MAVNCSVVPRTIEGFVGVTVIETGTGITVRVVGPEIFSDMAVIVVEPAATEVAMPFNPAALLIVATEPAEELQTTDVVMFFVLLSE